MTITLKTTKIDENSKDVGFARSFHRTDQVFSPQLGTIRAQKLAKKATNLTVTLW
jgi:hypothetical protein